MRLQDYPVLDKLGSGDKFIVSSDDNGTRTVVTSDFPYAVFSPIPSLHKEFVREKYLGAAFTPAQKNEIVNGTFLDLWLGDYWTIGGRNWRIIDFDYATNKGSASQLVIMPDEALYNARFNPTATTSGGYLNSELYVSGLTAAKNTIVSAFGASNIKKIGEFLTSATDASTIYDSTVTYIDVDLLIPSAAQIFGYLAAAPQTVTTGLGINRTANPWQFSYFAKNHKATLTPDGNTTWWLRDKLSSSSFARVDASGGLDKASADVISMGVRPYFVIG